MSPISAAIVYRVSGDPPDPRAGHQERQVAVISARAPQPLLDLVVIRRSRSSISSRLAFTCPSHGSGNSKAREQPPAGDAEQVRHRDLMAVGDQRGMHAVLEDRAVLDQMRPPPGALPLGM